METINNIVVAFDEKLIQQIGFATFAVITFMGAAYLLFTKNILYGAYGLLVTFLGMSGLYVFAGADFVAVTQIMVYVGGILVLMIFGIMLTQNKRKQTSGSNAIAATHQNITLGIVISVLFFVCLLALLYESHFVLAEQTISKESSIQGIGLNLMTEQLLVFEVVGVLLLIALIGAAFVAKKLEKE